MNNDRKFVGKKTAELRELATEAVDDPLATRFDMFVQLVRDRGSIDDPIVGSFSEGFRLALEEADKKLAPPIPDVFRVRWEYQLKGGSDAWHKYELVLPESEARILVSKDYPVLIRRNVRLEARVDGRWILLQEGETEEPCAND